MVQQNFFLFLLCEGSIGIFFSFFAFANIYPINFNRMIEAFKSQIGGDLNARIFNLTIASFRLAKFKLNAYAQPNK